MVSIDWSNVLQTLIPLILMGALAGIAKVVYDYRKNIFLWFKKQKLKLFPSNFNVALSVDFKEGFNSGIYYEQIKKNLLKLVDDAGLHGYIRVNDFSDIHKFKDKSEAELFRSQKNLDLIIWGSFTNDGLKKEGEVISKISLYFTYGHPDNKERTIGRMILLDINSKLALKNYWQIVDKNSHNDVAIVSNNIFDISTYILALTLKLYGRIEKSLSLFESLYDSLDKRQDSFKQHVIPHLINCYELTITERAIKGKDLEIGKTLCKKLLKLKKNYLFALLNLPVFQYKTGEKLEAEKSVELLSKLYPKNPLTEVDVAFFRILQKKYSIAYKQYNNLLKYQNLNFNPQDVIEFLSDEYRLRKDPALLYGSGLISMYFGDKRIAYKDLNLFLRKANEETYGPMYKKAKELLSKIDK